MAICGSTKPVSLAELLQLSKITTTAFSTCTSAEELSTTAYDQGGGGSGEEEIYGFPGSDATGPDFSEKRQFAAKPV